ncbi:MAG: RnfABCDGE type electron transport complex subunit B [Clostridiales bacterium]|nr:RnfABCDGE type electron transport complex subunit B [Clostridiales bacterium]
MTIMPIVYAILILGGLGVLFGGMLTYADKVFSVPVDERVQRIRENVAGANCGACGYAGCDAFAQAVAKGETPVDGCTPGGAASAKALAEIMGVGVQVGSPKVARVLCQGQTEVCKRRYDFDGYETCHAANKVAGGPTMCQYGCMGMGDCYDVCKFDAIRIIDNLAVIDEEKCTACGMCVTACPRDIIELLPKDAIVTVRCQSEQTPRETRDSCSKGCIACKRCEKACNYDAIHVNNNYARIDVDKCTRCGDCVVVCPTKCITMLDSEST